MLLAFLLLFRLGATPIYILDEAKNAECAREMMQRHDFIVPTFNGELRTDKPPLHYFFMMLSYKIFGVNEFAARFFSAIFGILTILVLYVYTKKFANAFTAFCSAFVLVASTHFLFEFRLSVPDPYLIFFITLGLFSGFAWLQQNSSLQLFIAAASLAFATLAKGPVALALPGLCLFIWIILKKHWKTVFTWKLLLAFLLFCVVALPWYIAVDRATNGEWTKGFFVDNNLNRFADPQEGHGGFFLITVLFVLIGLLPFVSFAGAIIKNRKNIFNSDLVKFGGIILLVFVVFFTVSSTRLPNYPMPCYPFAAIILGSFIASVLNGEIVAKKYPYFILIFITIAIPVAGYFAISNEAEANNLNQLPFLLLPTPFLLLVFLLNKKNNWSTRIKNIFFAYFIFNLIGLCYVYPMLYANNPVAKTIDTVKQYSNIYSYSIFNAGYRFYLGQNIPRTENIDSLKTWINKSPDAIVITRTDFLDSLKQLPLHEMVRHHDLFELPTTVILQKNALSQ